MAHPSRILSSAANQLNPGTGLAPLALAALVVLTALPSGPASAAPAPAYDLVALAAPSLPPAASAGDASDVTLVTYELVEIFAGEPASTAIRVEHRGLTDADRGRLTASERVVLLANSSPRASSGWTGPAPLRASDALLASFREWSAPEDVRPPRPLVEVLSEASDVTFAAAGDRPDAAPPVRASLVVPAPPPAPAEDASVQEEVLAPRFEPRAATLPLTRPSQAGGSSNPERATLVLPPRATIVVAPAADRTDGPNLPDAPRGIEASEPREVVHLVAAAPPRDTNWDSASPSAAAVLPVVSPPNPPFAYSPALWPMPGPGLPQAPPEEPLGPPLRLRSDLLPPARAMADKR